MNETKWEVIAFFTSVFGLSMMFLALLEGW